jgi:hypothetical protein
MVRRVGVVVLVMGSVVVGWGGATVAHAAGPPVVTADPVTELSNGQTVTVMVTKTVPSSSVTVFVCRAGAVNFVDNCDLASGGIRQTDASGAATTQVTVHATFNQGLGGPVDCTAAAGACVIGAGSNPDLGPEAVVPIAFAAAVPSVTTSTVATTTTVRPASTVAPAVVTSPTFTG